MRQRANGIPMRIGYVIWSLDLGGAEQVVIHLATECARRGHDVTVFTLNEPGRFAAWLESRGIPVIAMRKRPFADVSVLWRLKREFQSRQLDVVHTHLWGANFWGRLAAKLAGVPVIIATEHNVDVWKRPHYLLFDRWLARLSTALIAVSGRVRDFYETRGVGRGRWTVIYNGIPVAPSWTKRRGAAYRALGIRDEEPVVGWIGRLVPAKAPSIFLDAVATVCDRMPAVKVLMVGDGPLRDQALAYARSLGLEGRVIWAGLRQDVPELLAGMNVLAFSSEREGFSMAMLEAMAAGVPVVATRVGGTPELIDSGVNGILVEPGRADELADRLVELLGDSAKASAIRQAARSRVEQRYSLVRMVDAHEQIYKDASARFRVGTFDPPTRQPANPPTNVCYIIDDLSRGGAQRQLVELITALPRDRYTVHVISLSAQRDDCAEAIRRSGVSLTVIDHAGSWSWSTLWSLRRTLRTLRPRIVHTWLFTADLYGRLAATLASVPVILSAVRSVEPDKPWHYVAADRLLCCVTRAFSVNARAISEVIQRRERVPASKIVTIYNGIDLRAFDPASVNGAIRREIGAADGPVIGIVGRLAPVKDHDTFLRAASIVGWQIPSARFVIAGDGPLRASLEALARELGLEGRARFLGSRSTVTEVFAALDVLVVSSQYEGCSNVILEAMAMGKPVVATAVGGNPELVIAQRTGVLVPARDPHALAAALIELVNDPDRRRAMGDAGRRRVAAEFSVTRMIEETDRLYRRVLSSRRNGLSHP